MRNWFEGSPRPDWPRLAGQSPAVVVRLMGKLDVRLMGKLDVIGMLEVKLMGRLDVMGRLQG